MSERERISKSISRSVAEIMDHFARADLIKKQHLPEDESMSVRVNLKGIITGRLHILFSREAVTNLSSNLLGEDVVDSDSKNSMIGEIGNMIAGRFVSNIELFAKSVEIDTPVVSCGSCSGSASRHSELSCPLETCFGAIDVSLQYRELKPL